MSFAGPMKRFAVYGGVACAFVIANVAGAFANTTACRTVSACVFADNTGSGYGVGGTAAENDGVVGITTQKSTTASTGKAGVSGYDKSTNRSPYNSGVYGTSPYANGVQGKSPAGTGVYGQGGVYGIYGDGETGVYGSSETRGGAGMTAEATGGADVMDAYEDSDIGQPFGDGIVVETGYGDGLNVNTGRGFPLYLDLSDEGDTIIDAQSDLVNGDALVLDNSGNLSIAGTLTQNDAARFATRRADGRTVLTYAPREAAATLEDTGETALVRGAVRVALDPAFAATIDRRRPYLVFVTAEGENDGLYVTAKTAQGFTIRESHGGLSSAGVQYRIVAAPLASHAPRLPEIASVFPTSANFVREKQAIRARHAARLRARAARLAARERQSRTQRPAD